MPRAGVRIVRDRWNVPHITGKTRADVAWGAGWVTIEDRYLLIGLARNATALAALDVPGLDPFGVALSGQRFEPSRQTEAFLARQTQRAPPAGAPRAASCCATSTRTSPAATPTTGPPTARTRPLTRNDVYAVNAFAGRLFGRGGGDEAARSMFLDSPPRSGSERRRGFSVWNDLRGRLDPEAPVTIEKSFPYQNRLPRRRTGNRVLDEGSFGAWDSAPAASARARDRRHAEPAAREQLPDGRPQALRHRPSAVRGRARRSATSTPA